MAIDPVTGSLIIGGVKTLGGILGGPSEAEKNQRRQIEEQRRQFNVRQEDRRESADFAKGVARAQQRLRTRLLNEVGGIQDTPTDMSAVFQSRLNPFNSGQLGTNAGVSAGAAPELDILQFQEEFRLPPEERGEVRRSARPRSRFFRALRDSLRQRAERERARGSKA